METLSDKNNEIISLTTKNDDLKLKNESYINKINH